MPKLQSRPGSRSTLGSQRRLKVSAPWCLPHFRTSCPPLPAPLSSLVFLMVSAVLSGPHDQVLRHSTAETSLCPFSPEQSGRQELKPTGRAPRLTAGRAAPSPSGVCSRVSERHASVGRSPGPPLSTVSVALHHSGLTPSRPFLVSHLHSCPQM